MRGARGLLANSTDCLAASMDLELSGDISKTLEVWELAHYGYTLLIGTIPTLVPTLNYACVFYFIFEVARSLNFLLLFLYRKLIMHLSNDGGNMVASEAWTVPSYWSIHEESAAARTMSNPEGK